MAEFNEGICAKEVLSCFLCSERGTPIYRKLRDRRCNTNGVWSYLLCPSCGLIWLNPCPDPKEFEKIYTKGYLTHCHEGKRSRLSLLQKKINLALHAKALRNHSFVDGWTYAFGNFLSLAPPLKEIGTIGTMCLDKTTNGNLLDIGCAGGDFLTIMQDAGWDVMGVEPDNVPRRIAQQHYGVAVVRDTRELPDQGFDVVTMSHVIEHVHNPIGLLKECYRILKPGGKVVITTPNIKSLAHIIFRSSWSLLDPPRHIYLFSLSTLQTCVQSAEFQIEMLRTTAWYSRGTWCDSLMSRCMGKISNEYLTWSLKLLGWSFQILEELLRRFWKEAAEELVLVANKPNNSKRI